MASTPIPVFPQTSPLTNTTTSAYPPPSPSPSPSQAQAHFYSPTKPPRTQPNAHPYAIKTTSTALLSRSNSSSTNVQSTAHHYVPASSPSPSPSMSPSPSPTSPTPSSATNKDGGDREYQPRVTRHRYSRSLTSDMPMPLPQPPGTQTQAIAPSHSTPGFENPYAYTYANSQTENGHQPFHRRGSISEGSGAENDDDYTPRRKIRAHQHQRAETIPLPLPSVPLNTSALNSFDELPDDPKTWTSEHLAVYVGSDGNSNSGLMAKFVKEKNLSGRAFLRLAETDLDSLPHATRASLLALSRGLRHKLVQEKIFGRNSNGFSDLNQDHENANSTQHSNNDEDKHAPIGSLTRQHAIRPRRRSRVDSLSGASDSSSSSVSSFASDNGERDTPRTNARKRVKERVDALEEKIGLMEEEGTASSSSSAPAPAVADAESSNGMTPSKIRTKKSRIPQRGGVVSLFEQGPNTDSATNDHHHHHHHPQAVEGNGKDTSEHAPANGHDGARNDVEDKDSTITNVARKNVNGREARMLPFPPGFSSPHHHPHPHHPHEQHQHQHQHHQQLQEMSSPAPGGAESPAALDEYYGYEFGLRRAFGSAPGLGHPRLANDDNDDPHAGVYVVRHHPSSPRVVSGSGPGPGPAGVLSPHNTGGEIGRRASPRLLPYPPVVGRAVLHHPRPRRPVGLGVGGSETTTTASDTGNEVWETAREDFGGPGNEKEGEGDEEEEELSVQELLLREAEAASPEKKKRVVSGVDAWEMELGDTVKRVGDVSSGADAKIGGGGGGGSAEIMRLFDGASGGQVKKDQEEEAIRRRLDEIERREDAVRAREDEVKAREDHVRAREEDVKILEEGLKAKEEGIRSREEDVGVKADNVHVREDAVRAKEQDVDGRLREVEERERALGLHEEEVGKREADLVQREVVVGKREEDAQQKEKERKKRDTGTEDESIQTVLPPSTVDKAIATREKAAIADVGSQTQGGGDVEDDISLNGHRYGPTKTVREPYVVSSWTVKRDWFLGQFKGIFAGARLGVVGVGAGAGAGAGGALVLMGLGMCAVVLRVLARKVLGGAAAHVAAGGGRR